MRFSKGKWIYPVGLRAIATEGGAHTGRGLADDSCQVGVPSGVNIANRRFVVDETIGAVVAFWHLRLRHRCGGSGPPHAPVPRGDGKLRYVADRSRICCRRISRAAAAAWVRCRRGEAAPNTQR